MKHRIIAHGSIPKYFALAFLIDLISNVSVLLIVYFLSNIMGQNCYNC